MISQDIFKLKCFNCKKSFTTNRSQLCECIRLGKKYSGIYSDLDKYHTISTSIIISDKTYLFIDRNICHLLSYSDDLIIDFNMNLLNFNYDKFNKKILLL